MPILMMKIKKFELARLQAGRQVGRLTGRQTDRQTDTQTDRKVGKYLANTINLQNCPGSLSR